jgi:hypothetical protein
MGFVLFHVGSWIIVSAGSIHKSHELRAKYARLIIIRKQIRAGALMYLTLDRKKRSAKWIVVYAPFRNNEWCLLDVKNCSQNS